MTNYLKRFCMSADKRSAILSRSAVLLPGRDSLSGISTRVPGETLLGSPSLSEFAS